MPDLIFFPWAINQDIPEGYGYPAEALRAQHYAATSGGTGVDTPTALKVQAQPAPDGTILVLPGGATAASNYDGQVNQSYHAFFGVPQVIDIAPTGSSSSGRHDLVILRFIDPDHEQIPGYDGEYPIPADVATGMKFFWIEVIQGRSSTTVLPYPHVKLAHIRRGPNRTTVEPDEILDLRKLANPKTDIHSAGENLAMAEAQSLHTGTRIWPESATHTLTIPDHAAMVKIQAKWSTVHTHPQGGDMGAASGQVIVRLSLPGGPSINTQQSTWRTPAYTSEHRFEIGLNDTRPVPDEFRGQEVELTLRGNKTYGPNVYMDGDSSWSVLLFFEQDVA